MISILYFRAGQSVTYNTAWSRNAAALVMKINYDHDIADEGDVYVDLAEKAMASVGKAAIHGTYAVDYLPICEPHHIFPDSRS